MKPIRPSIHASSAVRILLGASLLMAFMGPLALEAAAEASGLQAAVNVPVLEKAPTLDGNTSNEEWDHASGGLVAVHPGNDQLRTPSGRFRIGQHGGTLYLLFVTDNMPHLPVSTHTKRDENIFEDDAVEFILRKPGGEQYQLIVNGAGAFFDSRDRQKTWNGKWTVATSTIGNAFQTGADAPRGFVVEASLPLSELEIASPVVGDGWGFQVVFDQVGANPHAVWSAISGGPLLSTLGSLSFGGPVSRIESARVLDGGRRIEIQGVAAEQGEITAVGAKASDPTARVALNPGPFAHQIQVPSGAYTVRLRAGAGRLGFTGVAELPIPLVAKPAPGRHSFFISIDRASLDQTFRERRLEFVLREAKETGVRQFWSAESGPGDQSGPKTWWVDYAAWNLSPGHRLTLEVRDGQSVEPVAVLPLRIPLKPEWESFRLPADLPKVPPPFEPVRAAAREAAVWGRHFRLSETPFVDSLQSNGGEVLAAPIKLNARTRTGETIEWTKDSWELGKSSEDVATYRGLWRTDGLTLRVETQIGYDGVTRFDWTLAPTAGMVELRDLHLILPVRKDVAKLFRQFRSAHTPQVLDAWQHSGKVSDTERAMPFTPFYWLGNEARGIEWFAESSLGWTPADPKRAVRIVPGEHSVDLVVHLADGVRQLDKPLSFTFGIVPSPIKPREHQSDFQNNRIVVLTAGGQLTGLAPSKPTVIIPAAPQDMSDAGCIEVDLRPDWNVDRPAHQDVVVPLFSHQDSREGAVRVEWVAKNKDERVLRVVQTETGTGARKQLLEVTSPLRQGQWHRLALNFSNEKGVELFVDGKHLGEAPALGSPLPTHDYHALRVLAPAGRLSLKAWRFSDGIRAKSDLGAADRKLDSDAKTRHLTRIDRDPTAMNVAYSQAGYLSSPAYLGGVWKYHTTGQFIEPGSDQPQQSAAQWYANMGVGGAVLFVWDRFGLGHGGPTDTVGFKHVIDTCNAVGIRVLPYTPDGLSDRDPAFEDYKWELSPFPPTREPPHFWQHGTQRWYSGPPSATAKHVHNLWQIDQFMRLGAGGVYLDGQTYPSEAGNPLNGTETLDPLTGKPAMTYRIFEQRQFLLDMYRLIRHHRPDALMDAHNSMGLALSLMAGVTDYTNGENIGWHRDRWPDWVKPDTFRAEFAGIPSGFNADALFYFNYPAPPEYIVTLCALHGQNPRLMWGLRPERAEKLWRVVDRFEVGKARFVPYYDDKPVVTPVDSRVLASSFVHPGKRTLLLISNWSDEENVNSTLRVNWQELGFNSTPKTVHLLNWKEPLPVDADGTLQLPIARPRELILIWIGDGSENATEPLERSRSSK